MRLSTLPFPFANAMDVINQVLFLIISASFTSGKLENADLHDIASQLKVTHYDWGEITENPLYALNQVSKGIIASENLEVSRTKITMNTFSTRNQRNCLKSQISEWTIALWLWRRLKHERPSYRRKNNRLNRYSILDAEP